VTVLRIETEGRVASRTMIVTDAAAGAEILKSAAEDRVRMWPLSRRVNKTDSGDDDPTLIDEVAA
jgi:hypothetical protein